MQKIIVFGGGCFWCTEAVFQQVDGVSEVVPGYAGGDMENPDYEAVASGRTGHAEVVQVTYDSEKVSLDRLLRIFFATHDPTTLNQQGADVGTQYRSAIYYTDDADKQTIDEVIADVQTLLTEPITTEVKPLGTFYEAEDYHHDYYQQNRYAPYCQVVIDPKLDKLRAYLREHPL